MRHDLLLGHCWWACNCLVSGDRLLAGLVVSSLTLSLTLTLKDPSQPGLEYKITYNPLPDGYEYDVVYRLL